MRFKTDLELTEIRTFAYKTLDDDATSSDSSSVHTRNGDTMYTSFHDEFVVVTVKRYDRETGRIDEHQLFLSHQDASKLGESLHRCIKKDWDVTDRRDR